MNLLDSKLEQKGLSPNDFTTAKAYIQDLMTIDTDVLVTPNEIYDFLQYELVDNAVFVPGQKCSNPKLLDCEIFVPGRVVSIWNNNSTTEEINNDVATTDDTTTPAATELKPGIPNVGGCALDGTMHVLRTIFLETDIISDHNIAAYRMNLLKLLKKVTTKDI